MGGSVVFAKHFCFLLGSTPNSGARCFEVPRFYPEHVEIVTGQMERCITDELHPEQDLCV